MLENSWKLCLFVGKEKILILREIKVLNGDVVILIIKFIEIIELEVDFFILIIIFIEIIKIENYEFIKVEED